MVNFCGKRGYVVERGGGDGVNVGMVDLIFVFIATSD
jgi:hypothetical protein